MIYYCKTIVVILLIKMLRNIFHNTCNHKVKISIFAKCADLCSIKLTDEVKLLTSKDGYCPNIEGIGSGKYINISICTNCKQVLNIPTLSNNEWIDKIGGKEDENDE